MTAFELRAKFNAELLDLQNSCLHTHRTSMPYEWAPGHLGDIVLVCNNCEKIISGDAK